VERWHDQVGDPTYADAILDRLVHNAHRIELRGGSMRQRRAGVEERNGMNTEPSEVIPDIHAIHSEASTSESKT